MSALQKVGVHPANVGDLVSYEDQANPRREGEVLEILRSTDLWTFATQYRVRWNHDGTETVSDLRQPGWRLERDCRECGQRFPWEPTADRCGSCVSYFLDADRDEMLVGLGDFDGGSDYAGAFDGHTVTSDADPGL